MLCARLARQRRQQFILAVPCNTADAQNLARTNVKRHTAQACAETISRRKRQILYPQKNVAQRTITARRAGKACADHHFGQFSCRFFAWDTCVNFFSVPQNGRCVTDRPNFIQFMRNIENRRAFGFQFSKGFKENVYLLWCQNRCRFIHDQEFWILQKTPNDFDALPLTCGQPADCFARIQWKAIVFRNLFDLLGQIALTWWIFHTQRNVFGDRQRIKQ